MMPVVRTFGCDDCGLEFEVTQDMADSPPDCPRCCTVLEWRPVSFSITGTKAKAVDLTQRILEQDYGLNNFNDRMREGDIAAIPAAAPSTVERDAQVRQLSEVAQATGAPPLTATQAEMAKAFWAGGQTPLQQIPAAEMLSAAKQATAAARAEGVDAMQLLHSAGKKGQLKTPVHYIAKA